MRHCVNLIGPTVVRLRVERGWTQDHLVGRLQRCRIHMTRDILASIETGRGPVYDYHIAALATAFGVSLADLFPLQRIRANCRIGIGGACPQCLNRTRKDRRPARRRRLGADPRACRSHAPKAASIQPPHPDPAPDPDSHSHAHPHANRDDPAGIPS